MNLVFRGVKVSEIICDPFVTEVARRLVQVL